MASSNENSAPPAGNGIALGNDLQGVSRLVIDAVAGVTDIVEDMHRTIAGIAPPVGAPRGGRIGGISGLVYRSVRGITRAVGAGLDVGLGRLAPLLDRRGLPGPGREAMLAALNGVLGDYLEASGNPLAIPMQLRWQDQPLVLGGAGPSVGPTGGRLLVLLHGLCMNDLQWRRDGHDHGAALAAELGYAPIYLRYNSGRRISSNGRELAGLLQRLLDSWPEPVTGLTLLGHSMGGLLARSAIHYATEAGLAWPTRLEALACLGSPHHGSPLERAGNRVDMLLGISPYSAPFTRLGMIRSAGIQDLRHGNLLDEDWCRQGTAHPADARRHLPLPQGPRCFLLAASKQKAAGTSARGPAGDGLVPVNSALGRHPQRARCLRVAAGHRAIHYGLNHFELLGNRDVYARLRRWLGEP